MPGQQFLSDAVTVVVGQHVHRLIHPQMLQQSLLQIRLFQQAVAMVQRLG